MAYSDPADDILASSLVLLSYIVNQKQKLNLTAHENKNVETVSHCLRTQLVKENRWRQKRGAETTTLVM